MVRPCSSSRAEPGHGLTVLLVALLLAAGAATPVPAPAAVEAPPDPPASTTPRPPRVPGLWMPIRGPVVRGFDARAGRYGPGHRGIDIAAPVGEPVRAPARGRVVFAGPVAGTTWLTLEVAPGVLVTVGPLLEPVATTGRVRSTAPVGRLGPGHGAGPGSRSPPEESAGRSTLHLSVRVDGAYVDPLAYLVDRPRARLAPLLAPGGLPTA
jgi:septal ring factor EnvC (AmiA/AmiB activator)